MMQHDAEAIATVALCVVVAIAFLALVVRGGSKPPGDDDAHR